MDYLRTSQLETLEGSIGRIQVSILGMLCIVLRKNRGIKVFAYLRELAICTDHPGGNLVLKAIKFDVRKNNPLQSLSRPPEQTIRAVKLHRLSQFTTHIF